MPQILRERSRDKTLLIIPFEDLVEEVISYRVLSPQSKAFIRELLIFIEERNTKVILLQKELYKKNILLNIYKKYKIGKKVIIESYIILSRDSILRKVEKVEKVVKEKKAKKSKKKAPIILSSLEEEEEDSKDKLA